jgi:hypothetical protein
MSNSLFNKNKCLQTINNLKKFYKTDKFKEHSNKEIVLLRNVIETCYKEKCPPDCPRGYYYLHGKCLYG